MTDKIEVMARAIARICNEKGQELASKCEAQAPLIPWQAFEREAKAAIEAIERTHKIVPLSAFLRAVLGGKDKEWDDR